METEHQHQQYMTKALPSGACMPRIGLGVYQSASGKVTYDAVLSALKIGYRHFDTAQIYHNEADIARAIKDSGIPREEIFITTKLSTSSFGYDKATAAINESFELLGGTYIDLLLLHGPGDNTLRSETWAAMELLQSKGLVRDIGVSNFGSAYLEKLCDTANVKPCVNQVELHPWNTNEQVAQFCHEHHIIVEANSPLANAEKLDDPVLVKIAKEVHASPAQVLIAWSLAKGFVVLPKSTRADRQQQNFEARNLHLKQSHIERLDQMDQRLMDGVDPIRTYAV